MALIAELTEALQAVGVECSVFATVGRRVGTIPVSLGAPTPVQLFATGRLDRIWVAHSPALSAALDAQVPGYDVVHLHELWHHPLWSAYRAATRHGVPYVITPHGQLDSWALSQKAWKKRLFSLLVQRRILRRAAAVHALNSREAQQVCAYGVSRPACVIPNATNVPPAGSNPDRFYARFPHLAEKQLVLFLGRIAPQKGVDVLIEAFALVARSLPRAHLAVVGPDNIGLAGSLERRCEELGISRSVTFTGPLYGADKCAALAAASLFVLPSRFEGQSKALLEAMAAGLPSVVTAPANSPDVRRSKAGAVAALEPLELSREMIRILSDEDVARDMGENARRTVEEEYSWPRIAAGLRSMYEAVAARPNSRSRSLDHSS